MRKIIAAVVVGVALGAAGIQAQQAQQTPPGHRAYLNFGVPTQTHFDGCQKEDATAKAAGWNLAFGLGVYRTCQSHVVAPTRVGPLVAPKYTADALRAKVQGLVVLAAVINPDGSVGDVRVLQSLDKTFGLDDAAVDAVRQTQYTPGRLGANAVPVAVIIEQNFTIR